MSRRCRASLIEHTTGAAGDGLSSGCDCGRLGPEKVPCTEPAIYGGNILLDPSMEQTPGEFGLNPGPFGEQFPGDNGLSALGVSSLRWADSSFYQGKAPFWHVFSNDGVNAAVDNRWHISTVNPNIGTYHARVVFDTGASYVTTNAALHPSGFYLCSGASRAPVGAIVAPGDLVTMSVVAMANVLTDSPTIQLVLETASRDFDGVAQWPSFSWPIEEVLTTGYTLYEFAAFMPAKAYYLQAEYWAWIDSGPTVRTVVDYDDFVLGILPAGQGILLCAQATLITIDNDTTETFFL